MMHATHNAYVQVHAYLPILVGDMGLREEVGDEGKPRKKRNSYNN